MSNPSNPLPVAAGGETLSSLLKRDAYANRFKEVLGERAPQFVSSLIAVGNSLPNVEPRSIIGSAMTAACLDLPIDKNLGFAWIVPYKGVATFQMGYKGYVQLGLRSAQYQRMNASPINREVFVGWDEVGEPILDWDQYDPEKETWGYFFGFQLVNGFTKRAVWTQDKVREHAQRYSQSFRAGKDIWIEQFDGMALKTVITNTLRKWGPLSVQMQQAFRADSAVIKDIDAEPEYPTPDEPQKPVMEHPEQKRQAEEEKKRMVKEIKADVAELVDTAKKIKENAAKQTESKVEKKPEPKPEPESKIAPEPFPPPEPPQDLLALEKGNPTSMEKKAAEPENVVNPPAPPEPEPPKLSEVHAKLKKMIEAEGYTFEQFIEFAWPRFIPKKESPNRPSTWTDIIEKRASWFVTSIKGVATAMKNQGNK